MYAGRCVERAETVGLELIELGIKDVILPGEMKELLNRVIQAQKEAEANVILRREETAATRSHGADREGAGGEPAAHPPQGARGVQGARRQGGPGAPGAGRGRVAELQLKA